MKHLFTLLAIAALSLTSHEVLASELAQKSPGDQTALQAQFGEMNMSASEFAALTPKEIAKKTGKKMSWSERILMKITQKRIKKQIAKGVQPPPAEGKAKGSSKLGIISIILIVSGVGLALLGAALEVNILAWLGGVCIIAGLIFCIIGLIKDENKVAAIIGTALSAIVLFIIALLFSGVFGSFE